MWVEEVCGLDKGQPGLVRQGHHRDNVPGGRIVHEWVEEVCGLDEGESRLVRQGRHRDSVPGGKDRPQAGRRSLWSGRGRARAGQAGASQRRPCLNQG
jgi:hypothetical protein